MAQVTMYGRMDVGMNNQKTTVVVAGVSTTTKANNLVNEDGLSTGLWGIMGSEDLGGGLKASFKHEMDLDMDVGALNVATGRNSTLGLSGGFGEVRLGRSYTPLFSTIGASDVFGTTGATTVGLYPDGVRASNGLFYTSPNFGGVTLNLLASSNNTSVTGTSAKDSTTGLSATYAAGPLMVSVAHGIIDATAGAVDAESKGSALAFTYDLGVAKVYAGYTTGKVQASILVDSFIKSTETNLGVSVPMGALTLMAGYGKNNVDTRVLGAVTESSGNDFVAGATYALSKRTTTYLKTGTYNKLKTEGVNTSTKTNRTSLGIRHTF